MRLAAALGVKKGERYVGLKTVDVTARTPEEVIATAYAALAESD
jgi:hypothetical protein